MIFIGKKWQETYFVSKDLKNKVEASKHFIEMEASFHVTKNTLK